MGDTAVIDYEGFKDGVADCGDGLPIEVSRERRLEIMKDSRLGTFGGTLFLSARNLIWKL